MCGVCVRVGGMFTFRVRVTPPCFCLTILLRTLFFLQAEALSGRPPPRRSALLGLVPAGWLASAFGADVSASQAVSRETLLHGDGLPRRYTPFLWARAAAARSSVAPSWMAAARASEGREGERARKHPAGSPSHRPGQRLFIGANLEALSARY